MDDAKRDVDRMMRQAELEAKTKVSDSEVLLCRQGKSAADRGAGRRTARKLYQVANEYAEDALGRTEEAVQAALDEVKQSRVRFRTVSSAKMQEQRDRLDGKMDVENGGDSE